MNALRLAGIRHLLGSDFGLISKYPGIAADPVLAWTRMYFCSDTPVQW